MESNEEGRSPALPGSYAGRRRSISIVDAQDFADHSPAHLSAGRTAEAARTAPPPPPPLQTLPHDSPNASHSQRARNNTNHNNHNSVSVGGASTTLSPSKAPSRAQLATPRAHAKPDDVVFSPNGSTTSAAAAAGTAMGTNSSHNANISTPERTSLFREPAYRGTSASTTANHNHSGNNNTTTNVNSGAGNALVGGGAGGSGASTAHPVPSPPGSTSLPATWRRAFSPLTGPGGGGSAGFNSSSTAGPSAGGSKMQRPSSLLYRRPSSATSGSHGAGRVGAAGGGGGGAGNALSGTAAASGAVVANVYTLQLNEDDGGAEMAAARPLLLEALRLRDKYKTVDKGQVEMGGGGGSANAVGSVNMNNNNNSPGTTSVPSTSPSMSGVTGSGGSAGGVNPVNGPTALQQVDGVFYWTDQRTPIVSWQQFTSDVMALAACVQNPSCISVANYRLQVLEEKYHLHRLYNADVEENGDRYRRGGGLYANSCRVDNFVGAATVMNAHWLVEYIQQTVDARGGDLVESADVNYLTGGGGGGGGSGAGGGGGGGGSSIHGNNHTMNGGGNGSMANAQSDAQTLERVFELLDFPDPYQLTVEGLGLQPSVNRALPYYDALDPALNGSGRNSAALLRLFLSMRGGAPQRGDYLADAVQPSLTRNELRTSCPQATEMALEITGVLAQEWEQTAAWVRTHELDNYRTNQFQINFPVMKWCGSGTEGLNGGGGGGGSSVGRGGLEDGPSGSPIGGSEAQSLYKLSVSGAARGRGAGGSSGGASNNYNNNNSMRNSNNGGMDAAALLDAAPQDVLNYENYQQLLDHLFLPLFMATLAPEDPKFVDLATLLQRTGAIVLSGDESTKTRGGLGGGAGGTIGSNRDSTTAPTHVSAMADGASGSNGGGNGGGGGGGDAVGENASRRRRRPADVPYTEPVSLSYLYYHIWANLCSLNALRRRRGQNVLQLRVVAANAMLPNTSSPHDASLLLLSYLIADVVVDAVALDKQPALQYLYGLHQVGVAMCPMARGSLGTTNLSEHPLARLLWRGLHVSLCTVSPLYYHASLEPLMEEYATAAKCHRLSPTDISEISLHSVCMSAFEEEVKASWIGAAFVRDGWRGNAAELTNVPTARLQLRYDSWVVERKLLFGASGVPSPLPAPLGPVTIAGAGGGGGGFGDYGTAVNKRGSVARPRDVASAGIGGGGGSGNRHGGGGNPSPLRRPGSASGVAAMHASAAASQQQQASPYTVLDPAVSFPRLFLMGPYDRDIANAHIAQSLHRALDLRHQYSALPLPHPSNQSPSPAAVAAAAAAGGADGSVEDVRNSWLAALIHDPTAVLPHPTQSMSWAFKKAPLAAVPGAGRPSSPAVAAGGVVVANAAALTSRPHLHFDEDEWKYKTVEGVIVPHEVHQIPRLPQDMYHYDDFCRHVQEIRHLIDHIRVREFALRRLQLLEHRFLLHAAVNHSLELGSTAGRASQNRDFYQSTKVDNNIRMETGMTARQLLAFIVDKATHSGDDIVSHPKGKEPQTLRQLLSELHISPHSLTVDDLNIQAGATSSNGGAPHNPFAQDDAQDELLTLLLKTDNQMNGRYFAELTKRTFEELSRDQHTFVECRLPVYGASAGEWGLLSHWFDTHGMASSHNQWVVQVPRIYSSLRKAGRVASFAEYLEHIFEPLWRISLHPNSDPRLFHFVNHIAAFDCVEDERRPDLPLAQAMRAPHEWTSEEEPPYNYYLYHLYANLRSLNRFRQRRRFSVFAFRPSCGEAGSVDHLIGGFLLAQNISYGVRLADSAPLQYLFYLAQIGVTVSPLSNNTKLDLNYLHNPFPEFFRRGLRVSLGTDSPLLYHHTQEPLLEEYSIASKIWKLSPNDLSEVARNSVLLSNFSMSFKEEKLGPLYFLSSSAGNDVTRTHLSDVRVAYRFETYHTEVGFLEYISGQHFHKALLTLPMEAQCKQLCGMATSGGGSDGTRKMTGKEESGASASRRGSPGSADVLIDPTPKEADLKQLEQQRARMQRQLRELTSAVADLHKQNRLLTTKLGEEKERDQQAAHLRRHRVGDKLRELQVLLDQKQVHPHGTPTGSGTRAEDAAFDSSPMQEQDVDVFGHGDTPNRQLQSRPSAAASDLPSTSRSTSLLPFSPSPTSTHKSPPSMTTSGRGTTASSGKLNHSRDTASLVLRSADGTTTAALHTSQDNNSAAAAAADGGDSVRSAPPAPVLSSKDVFSSVRSRTPAQREETIAQTRQLLAHSESLWRSTAPPVVRPQQPPQVEGRGNSALPPLETPPSAPRKRWSPSPSMQD